MAVERDRLDDRDGKRPFIMGLQSGIGNQGTGSFSGPATAAAHAEATQVVARLSKWAEAQAMFVGLW